MTTLETLTGLALVAAAAIAAAAEGAAITGTATYRERMLLPEGAVLEATLEEVSRADAPATVIGRARVESPGSPPLRFSIAYDPAAIVPRHRYVVRARVTVGERLLFTTDTAHPVLGTGGPTHVDLLMKRVDQGAAAPGPAPGSPEAKAAPPPTATAALENTYWKLVGLQGRTVVVGEKQREPHVILHPDGHRLSGSGGCNRLLGSYALEGPKLSFGRAAGTLMTCPQGMEQEHAFLDALARVQGFGIRGQQLELVDAQGATLARLEAVYLK
jgi:putative lipoprotein